MMDFKMIFVHQTFAREVDTNAKEVFILHEEMAKRNNSSKNKNIIGEKMNVLNNAFNLILIAFCHKICKKYHDTNNMNDAIDHIVTPKT